MVAYRDEATETARLIAADAIDGLSEGDDFKELIAGLVAQEVGADFGADFENARDILFDLVFEQLDAALRFLRAD
jgi:hypothetical protein